LIAVSTTTTRDLSTTTKVIEFLEEILEHVDYAFAYGEPGYDDPAGETPLIVFSTYWCRCRDYEDERHPDSPLHPIDVHYPAEFELLEEQGVKLEWYDEWIIDHETSKAYRTEADGAFWMPSYVLWECDLLTPDNSIETWLDWITENPPYYNEVKAIPERALPVRFDTVVGWEQWPDDTTDFRNDWYGNNDDPAKIQEAIRREHGEETYVVFIIRESHMFGVRFEAYYKLPEED
jgi:hypothetical protein